MNYLVVFLQSAEVSPLARPIGIIIAIGLLIWFFYFRKKKPED